MEIEFDPAKERQNRRKHSGIGFEEAAMCPLDPMAGKTRITMRVDNQTLMNAALGDYLKGQTLADGVRETIREELSHA